ncbi:MAG: hypothetical protein OXD42_08445, partial [Rhodospirillaceae bacterium]|nr:hypothetical protein [Rhodospirillaceae bacterium]
MIFLPSLGVEEFHPSSIGRQPEKIQPIISPIPGWNLVQIQGNAKAAGEIGDSAGGHAIFVQ